MRIYIKTEEGKNIKIPIPMGLASFLTRLPIKNTVMKRLPPEKKESLEKLDLGQIRQMLKELKAYKGLNVVEVNCKDGTEVRITI